MASLLDLKTSQAAPTTEDQTQTPMEMDLEDNVHNLSINCQLDWNGPDDPSDPNNWPSSRKITIGIVCSGSQLITTMSASMIAPALDMILDDLQMTKSAGQIAFSVFFLGLGFAPFLVAPLSETYGRKPIWVLGNLWYILWNSLCPVGYAPAMLIVGRLMSASGASVGITLTGPILADMYKAKDRGRSQAIATLLPYAGPALGPIVGGLAAQHLRWPWLFWILSFADVAFVLLGVLLIQETYAPELLRRKAKRLGCAGTSSGLPQSIANRRALPDFRTPLRLLFYRPIVMLLALATAIEFGIYTLVLSSFASLWITRYNESAASASLHYIAIALGAFLSAQVGGHGMDYIWRCMEAKRPNQAPVPEYRIPYIAFGLLPCAVGIFWYAWAAQRNAHWAVVDLGIFMFTTGGFMFAQGLFAYLVDEFTSVKVASASAATRLLTYVLGFVFPIFAPALYQKLDYGWGNSLLGFVFIAICIPITLLLWLTGPRIRAISFAPNHTKE